MINKGVRKSLSRKKGNEILIWSWNNPLIFLNVQNCLLNKNKLGQIGLS